MGKAQRDVSTPLFERQEKAKLIAFFKELDDIFWRKVGVLPVCVSINPQQYMSKHVDRVQFVQIPFTFDYAKTFSSSVVSYESRRPGESSTASENINFFFFFNKMELKRFGFHQIKLQSKQGFTWPGIGNF